MNWLKVIGFTVAAPLVHALDLALTTQSTGGHAPITSGNILLPAIPGLILTLAALFTHKPTTPGA